MKTPPIAFIGLGAMGWHMAGHLQNKHACTPCLVWSRTHSHALDHQKEFGTVAVESIQDLKDCVSIFLCLPSHQEVQDVVYQLKPILKKGTIIIDTTSSVPEVTQTIQKDVSPSIQIVDAPISGGPHGRKEGSLCSMVGGHIDVVHKVRPLIQTYSTKIIHTGPTGTGHATKAINNLLNIRNFTIKISWCFSIRKNGSYTRKRFRSN